MTPIQATHGARLPPHRADSRSDAADLLTAPTLLTGRNQRRAIAKLNALFAAYESSIEPFIKEGLGDGDGGDR
jgi:hypothetical protein